MKTFRQRTTGPGDHVANIENAVLKRLFKDTRFDFGRQLLGQQPVQDPIRFADRTGREPKVAAAGDRHRPAERKTSWEPAAGVSEGPAERMATISPSADIRLTPSSTPTSTPTGTANVSVGREDEGEQVGDDCRRRGARTRISNSRPSFCRNRTNMNSEMPRVAL